MVEPKPVQKPYPPLLFGGFSPRMIRLAGRYGDLCFIPPWIKTPFVQAKSIAQREARKAGRIDKLSFSAGSPMVQERFDMKALTKDIQTANDEGCE